MKAKKAAKRTRPGSGGGASPTVNFVPDSKSYTERRLLRRSEVEARIGLKRAQIYVMMREGKFPKSIRLGRRAVAWDSLEIDQWILDRVNAPR